MENKIHFMNTDKGYQYMCSTAYDETNFKEWDILKEVVEDVSERDMEKLTSSTWQEVREMIKSKIDNLNK